MTDARKDGPKGVRKVVVPTKDVQLPFDNTPPPVGAKREIHRRRPAPKVPTGKETESDDDSPPAEPDECEP